MDRFNENTCWIAIAHLPGWHVERINRLIIRVTHDKQLSWGDFFALDKKGWLALFAFTDKELADLENMRNDLPKLAFLAEQLNNEGFLLIPINSPDYPPVLKENLKTSKAPPVIYIKGRKTLLSEDAVAIVGSRKAGKSALEFTDLVAKKCALASKVVVSGFAKGVDRQALESTLEAGGKSIIVLPQGILTFQSGFKKYYEPIVRGEVLVLSTFFPKAGWDVGLAMARNHIIYGLAKEIYVAETDSQGGTWEGALSGLKRGRSIFARLPAQGEKNANLKLLGLGAKAVDEKGNEVDSSASVPASLFENSPAVSVSEDVPHFKKNDGERNIEAEILALLANGAYSAREILLTLRLDWDGRKLSRFLKNHPAVRTTGDKPLRYSRNDQTTFSFF